MYCRVWRLRMGPSNCLVHVRTAVTVQSAASIHSGRYGGHGHSFVPQTIPCWVCSTCKAIAMCEQSRPYSRVRVLGVSGFSPKIKFANLKFTLFWASTTKFFHCQYFVIYGIIVISGNSYPMSKIFICCNSFSSSAPSSVRGEGRSLLVCLVWICIALHLEVLNDM